MLLATSWTAAADWSLQGLMQRLAAVESRHVEYREERLFGILQVPLQSHGELYYQAPDHLKKTVLEGGHGSYEIRGERVRIEQQGEAHELHLSTQPVLAAFVASFRATLAGDLDTLRRYYLLDLEGTDADWILTLTPADPSMASAIKEVTIHGSGAALRRVEILEPWGDSRVMTILDHGD